MNSPHTSPGKYPDAQSYPQSYRTGTNIGSEFNASNEFIANLKKNYEER